MRRQCEPLSVKWSGCIIAWRAKTRRTCACCGYRINHLPRWRQSVLAQSPPSRCARCRAMAVATAGSMSVEPTFTQACPRPGLVWSTKEGSCPLAHIVASTGIGAVKVDQDVAGVSVLSIRMNVHLAVTHPQQANGGRDGQWCGSPLPFSRERPLRQVVDQTNEVEFAGHSRELAANGLRSESDPRSNSHSILQSNSVAVQ